MASKYDRYWLSIMEKIHNGIVESMKKGSSVYIDVSDITDYGKRNVAKWYGTVEVSSEGIKGGGEEAHSMSLGKMVMEQDFFKKMKNIQVKFKISTRPKPWCLEIDVVRGESIAPVESERKEKMVIPKRLSQLINKWLHRKH